jgi:hypothetical protein
MWGPSSWAKVSLSVGSWPFRSRKDALFFLASKDWFGSERTSGLMSTWWHWCLVSFDRLGSGLSFIRSHDGDQTTDRYVDTQKTSRRDLGARQGALSETDSQYRSEYTEKSSSRFFVCGRLGFGQAMEKFFAAVYAAVLRHLPFQTLRAIVIASPGFTREGVSRTEAPCSIKCPQLIIVPNRPIRCTTTSSNRLPWRGTSLSCNRVRNGSRCIAIRATYTVSSMRYEDPRSRVCWRGPSLRRKG